MQSDTTSPSLPETTISERTTTSLLMPDTTISMITTEDKTTTTTAVTWETITEAEETTPMTNNTSRSTTTIASEQQKRTIFWSSVLVVFSDSAKPNNLGLILDLSLGLGFPATVTLVAGAVYYVNKIKTNGKVSVNNSAGTNEFLMTKNNNATESNVLVTA
ncbi:unnamed protein product [Rotaria socialis]|uniref:Uncharacterized protein n=1 Tax=Rotaria socialis TaxID=392032 RepID=A0A820VKQ9_9BILA|nr:unnamed protein product [Rotaria socialis]CAF3413429.1 unnamed protein product [Rotaria socialis]CAF3476141.1 unnamed protein product [Rotaria socialis]CAF3549728.1 unnamed protein product [Rotaria socialis]CAF3702657.1 unnamed protein product [Rotaria socialis]